MTGRLLLQPGNSNLDPTPATFSKKVHDHAKSVRKRNKNCIEAIKPLLTFKTSTIKTSTVEFVELFLGNAYGGLRWINRTICTKMPLDACDKLRNAPKSVFANIVT